MAISSLMSSSWSTLSGFTSFGWVGAILQLFKCLGHDYKTASKCCTCSVISRLNICCLSASKTSLGATFASTLLRIRTWWTLFILPRGVFLSHPLYPSVCSGVDVLIIFRQYHISHRDIWQLLVWVWRLYHQNLEDVSLGQFHADGLPGENSKRVTTTMVPASPTSDWLSQHF